MPYKSLIPEQTRALSPDTVAEAVNTLRYLRMEFDARGTLDKINMRHVNAVLATIDGEVSPTPAADRSLGIPRRGRLGWLP